MQKRLPSVFLFACLVALAVHRLVAQSDLRIVVNAGEGAVNINQQKTAVAPIVEVRDRNNVPVSGATVTFSVSGKGATFSSGSTLTVTTNAAGQATATGFTPTAAGAVQVNVSAALKGLVASAVTITQTNFATAAAAAAAGAAGGGGASAAGAAGAGAAGAGGGLSMTTIAIIGGAVAGGAVVATQTGLVGGAEGFVHILGQVYGTAVFGPGACAGVRGEAGASNTCYLNPVSGAIVSTTLDSATASTDGAGNFDLTTTLPRSRITDCVTYTITITAAGHPTYTINTRGFSGNEQAGTEHRQLFALSPPVPTIMAGC